MRINRVNFKINGWFVCIAGQFTGNVIELWAYQSATGKLPYVEWFHDLDKLIKVRIMTRLHRVSYGNFGNTKRFAEGVWELRFNFGPGYRIYFAKLSDKKIGLICAGDKSTQKRDGRLAREIWKSYKGSNS